jgi:hypothetical protein
LPSFGIVITIDPKTLYIDLLKRCLTFSIWGGRDGGLPQEPETLKKRVKGALDRVVGKAPDGPVVDGEARAVGLDWPVFATP